MDRRSRLSALAVASAAFALYYVGSEALRAFCSDAHIGLGLILPALLAVHVAIGRRQAHASQRAGARPLTSAPASGDILRKNGTEPSEIIATPTKAG